MIQIVTTSDGSHSLFNSELNEHYHSVHGAIQESMHIFIGTGLHEIMPSKKKIKILEMGFGTGLNAFLTAVEAHKNNLNIEYTSLEAFPVNREISGQLNYSSRIESGLFIEIYKKILYVEWGISIPVTEEFSLKKINISLLDFDPQEKYDLVYFDAFAPEVQPELWTESVFSKIFKALNAGGILVTYSCKGLVKRNMKAAGFTIEKCPGPPGKREILRARK